MKLRRAMAVAAATAVIAPAAFLAAPAAYATDDTNTQTSTESASPGPSDTATEDTETGGGTGETTEPTDEVPAPTTEPTDEPTEPTENPPVDPTDDPTDEPTAEPTAESPAPSTSPTTPPSAEPTEPAECLIDEEDEDFDLDSALELGISGLPGRITAGSGWHAFTLRATNTSDKALGKIDWALFIDNESFDEDESKWLGTFTQVEFQDKSGKWLSAGELGTGIYIGDTTLGAKAYVDLKLRLNIGAKAPAGNGYAVGLAAYTDSDTNCTLPSYSDWEFEVLSAGSKNDNPGKPKPGTGAKPSETKPQGGANQLPPTGSLAETGSSSMVPVIGMVGGIAIVAGAGVMFAMKRRRHGDSAV
ncbi:MULTISPECIES: LPXTG cell wall anchor domain-containing protein [unclassified Streptomyces]|uniref:LPXTG cell wall anchor domain-containing protein n=1 Tax=unclassified Streptomyces TaxID=2593676 RepID=UPI00381A9087